MSCYRKWFYYRKLWSMTLITYRNSNGFTLLCWAGILKNLLVQNFLPLEERLWKNKIVEQVTLEFISTI